MFKQVVEECVIAVCEGNPPEMGTDDHSLHPEHYEADYDRRDMLAKHYGTKHFHKGSKSLVKEYIKHKTKATRASRKAYGAKRSKAKQHKAASDAHDLASYHARKAAEHMDCWSSPDQYGHNRDSLYKAQERHDKLTQHHEDPY